MWHVHGLLIGVVVGLPFLLHDMIAGLDTMILAAVFTASGILGIMIEFFTSKVFRLPAGE